MIDPSNHMQIVHGTAPLKGAYRMDWAVDDDGFTAGTIYASLNTDLDAGAQLGLVFIYWPGGRQVIAAIKNLVIKALVSDSEKAGNIDFTYTGDWIPRSQLPEVTETYLSYLNKRM